MSHQLLLSTTSDNTTTKANNLVGNNTQEDTETGGLIPNTYIAPVLGTTTSSLTSATALTANTWGFALANSTPGIVPNNFNTEAEYTSTDQTTQNTNKYTSVPAKNSEVLVLEDTTATSTTAIYYGVLADRSLPAGNYSNTILYTALAEQPSEIRVNPNTINLSSPNQPVTIYTSINTTASEIAQATATVSFYRTATVDGETTKVEEGTCANPSINLDGDNYLYITCTSPTLGQGSYTIEVTLSHFDRILTQSSAISYTGDPLIKDITTMQQMATAICNNLPYGTTDGHNIYTLKDSRDQKEYKIAHLTDGNCWMVQNLALDGGRTLHTTDSNVTRDRTLAANVSKCGQGTTEQCVYSPVAEHTDANGSPYGNLYNWNSATAGVGTLSSVFGTIYESVCPSNWILPNLTGEKSYTTLLNSQNITIAAQNNIAAVNSIQSPPLLFPLTGVAVPGGDYYEYEGAWGWYWTRQDGPYYAGHAQFMYISTDNNGRLNFSSFNKLNGQGVRCVFNS